MSDNVDDSQAAEAKSRQTAIDTVRYRPRGLGPDMSDGTPRCRDCGEEIPAARLAGVPDAERCLACQEDREQEPEPTPGQE
jgi:phage/conjugal plasmid C-4 type zinc finger TraR family protein